MMPVPQKVRAFNFAAAPFGLLKIGSGGEIVPDLIERRFQDVAKFGMVEIARHDVTVGRDVEITGAAGATDAAMAGHVGK